MADPQTIWVEVARDVDARASREHALVLQALGIPHGVIDSEGASILVVRGEHAEGARAEIGRYDRENAGWPPREEEVRSVSDGYWAAVAYVAVLAACFALEVRNAFDLEWWRAGAASTAAIRGGEWWRAATALSLHTDLSHLGSNLLFGAVFGVILARSLGSGIAWAGFLVAGTLGNALNAALQPEQHVSVGASTGVFGALGIQVAFEWMRRRETRTTRLRRWTPIAMGIALFLWLGTGGGRFGEADTAREAEREIARVLERVDVMAHVTGFAAGLGLGVLLGRFRRRLRLRERWQAVVGWGAVVALAGAWALAVTRR